jgi:hypothetical protein
MIDLLIGIIFVSILYKSSTFKKVEPNQHQSNKKGLFNLYKRLIQNDKKGLPVWVLRCLSPTFIQPL